MDIDKLMEALRAGEPWAGTALITVMAPTLTTHAQRVGRDLGDADRELAIDEAIRTAIRKIDQYDETRGGPGAWLRPFVTHAIADIRRARPASVELRPDLIAEDRVDAQPTRPEVVRLGWLVRELSETDQVILRLRDYERLEYADIAERIGGVTEGACRVRHHRAVRRLADLARASGEFDALLEENNE